MAIAGFTGYGGYCLGNGIASRLERPGVDRAEFWGVHLPYLLLYCGFFFALAYFMLRKDYRRLSKLIPALVGLVVGDLFLVYGLRPFIEWLEGWTGSQGSSVIALPLLLVTVFFAPYFAACSYCRAGLALRVRLARDDRGKPTNHHP